VASRIAAARGASGTARISIADGDRVAVSEKNMFGKKTLPKRSVRLPGVRLWIEKWWKYGNNFDGV